MLGQNDSTFPKLRNKSEFRIPIILCFFRVLYQGTPKPTLIFPIRAHMQQRSLNVVNPYCEAFPQTVRICEPYYPFFFSALERHLFSNDDLNYFFTPVLLWISQKSKKLLTTATR